MLHRYKNFCRHWLTRFIATTMVGLFGSHALAQTGNLNRPYQPVVLKGSSFAEFSNNAAPMSQLFLYKYISASNTWEQIPFQFDEVEPDPSPTDPNRTTYFGTGDGNLDDADELAFMARDAGGKAPTNTWVNDASARTFARYEIEVTDPISPGSAGYVYLFRSSTLSVPPAAKDYVSYVDPSPGKGNDIIRGVSYEEGHADNGINVSMSVPLNADPNLNGSGTDFLDRLKIRFQVVAPLFGAITFTDAGFSFVSVKKRDGRVRVIRELREKITLITGGDIEFSILILYYGYSSFLGTEIDLNQITSSVKIVLLRQSIDFAANVSGAKWYNQNVTAPPITVNGNSGSLSAAQASVVNAPNLNWYMLSSAHGSLINFFSLSAPAAGNSQKFYYYDAQSGTGDGTNDTGDDNKSYGDSGLMITGSDIRVIFNLALTSYFLGKDRPRSDAEALYSQSTNPLKIVTKSQRSTVAVQENPKLVPQRFALLQNSPNPVSLATPATVIRYELPFASQTAVSLRIFNLLGQNVRELVNTAQPAGRYEVQWDGRLANGARAPAGIYFYQLQAGRQIATQKLMLLNR